MKPQKTIHDGGLDGEATGLWDRWPGPQPSTLDAALWPLADGLPGAGPLGGMSLAGVPLAPAPSEVIAVDLTDAIEQPIGLSAVKAVGGGGGTSSLQATGGTTVSSYTSGAAGGYNIKIQFSGSWSATLQGVFKAAADRISKIIVGDVPNVVANGTTVDDITISASLASIDGVGGVLGQAGPTSVRSGSYLPSTATMKFDTADAQNYYNQSLFDEIVTHEMLHSIGFGAIWSYRGLVSGSNFTGSNAVAEYNKLVNAYSASHGGSTTLSNGTKLVQGAVPLETGGGSGTAGAHWSEAAFRNELMTGYINAGTGIADPLSAMTVASMKDLGYVTSATAPTDAYALA
jgi:hypothetical protein